MRLTKLNVDDMVHTVLPLAKEKDDISKFGLYNNDELILSI